MSKRGKKSSRKREGRSPGLAPRDHAEHPGREPMPTRVRFVPDADYDGEAHKARQALRGTVTIKRGDGTVEETGIETVEVGKSPAPGGWGAEPPVSGTEVNPRPADGTGLVQITPEED